MSGKFLSHIINCFEHRMIKTALDKTALSEFVTTLLHSLSLSQLTLIKLGAKILQRKP